MRSLKKLFGSDLLQLALLLSLLKVSYWRLIQKHQYTTYTLRVKREFKMQVNKNHNTHMPFLLIVKLRKNSNQWFLFLFLLHPQEDLYLLNKQKNILVLQIIQPYSCQKF